MDRAQIERDYHVVDGIVKSPGKFEGEAAYVVAAYHWSMDGGADDERSFSGGYWMHFRLTPTDTSEWPELEGREYLRIVENDAGFVYEVDWEPEPEQIEDEDAEDDS